MKKTAAVLSAALLMVTLTACGEGSGGGTQPPVGPVDNTVYAEIPVAPEYAAVDQSGYATYYFDGEAGDDGNSGTSPEQAKKTLSAANALISSVRAAQPTQILFKGGTSFTGELSVKSYAAAESTPLLISSYGTGKPLLNGNGEQTVLVTGGDVRVSDLEITNTAGKKGIYVYTTGSYKNLVIEDCYIHNVNWNWSESESEESWSTHMNDLGVAGVSKVDPGFVYETGGIVFFTASGETPCKLRNVWVKNNRIEKVSRSGILFSSNWVKRFGLGWGVNKYCDDEHGYYPSENVNFIGNRLHYTGGDGIVMIGVNDGFIDGNVSYHSNFLGRKGFANAGIWSISSKNIVIQRNEAAYSHLENGAADGQGLDIDIASENILMQYNYSHHNAGGGLLMCNTGTEVQLFDEEGNPKTENGRPVFENKRGNWEHAVIRNNLFVENGSGSAPAFANVTGSCYDVLVENNTIIFRKDKPKQQFMKVYLWDKDGVEYGKAERFTFRNNIFYCENANTGNFDFANMEEYLFVGNVYHNVSEAFTEGACDSRALVADPAFTIPADADGYDKVSLFAPANDTMFTGGLKLSEKNRFDLLGNETKGVAYFGAICKN